MIISQTPYNIVFFGDGTDHPEFYSEYGGSTLLTSIDRYCFHSIHEVPPLFHYKFRANYERTEHVESPLEFRHPLIRDCLEYLRIRNGLNISDISDIPHASDMGMSAHFTVGLLHALHAYRGDVVNPEELARESVIIGDKQTERPTGYSEPYAAAYGGFMRLDFSGKQIVEVNRLNVSPERLRQLESRLLMFHVGDALSSGLTHLNRTSDTRPDTDELKDMLRMVDKAQNILESDTLLEDWGQLLTESWRRGKTISDGFSAYTLHDIYERAVESGAVGGKPVVAGKCLLLVLYAEPEHQRYIRSALAPVMEIPLRFSPAGSRIILQTENSSSGSN